MIVKNEEACLGRCLESIKDEVDEIVIVDTGSTDGTVKIARRYTDKVYFHPWENDFSKHRNQCLAYASGQWIFILDADEELDAQSKTRLRETVKDASGDAFDAGVLCFLNDGTSTSFHRSPRLYRNNGAIHYEGIVHNQVVGYKDIKNSNITILHHGYDVDPETSLKRFNRTSVLLLEQIRQNPAAPDPYIYLSTSYISISRFTEALDASKKAVSLMQERQLYPNLGTVAYYNQATCYFNLNDFAKMVSTGIECRRHYPDDIDSCIALVFGYRGLEQWDEVIRWGTSYLTRIQKLDDVGSRVVMSLADTWKAHLFMGEAYLHNRDMKRGNDHFHKALAFPVNRATCLNAVIRILTHHGSFAEARPFVDLALQNNICQDAVTVYNQALRDDHDRKLPNRNDGTDGGDAPRNDRPQISLCMIVKNEGAFLMSCLQSVRDHVDEMIIVDTGSTDDTVAIAKSFGARVYHHPWQDDFSLHRNQSISYASGTWIFILDADEEYRPSSQRSLCEEIALAEKQGVVALSMQLESSQAAGKEANCFDAVRLFQNNCRIRYEGIVHETLTGLKSFAPSQGRIIHFGYDQGPESARKKFERTVTLLQRQIRENPENTAAHLYLSASYTSIGHNEEALREALTAVELVEAQEITNKLFVSAYYTAARVHSQAGHFDAAEGLCRRALARFGNQVDILAIQTKVRLEKKDWPGVIDSGSMYQDGLDRYRSNESAPELVSICTYGDEWKICCWMGKAKLHLADPAGAEALFARAMDISPDKLSVCRHAGTGYAESGNLDRSRFYLEEAYRLSGANKDQAVVEGLFKIALVTGDAALRDRSLTDALSLRGDLSIWLSDLADFAVSHRDSRSAVVLLAGIIAAHDGNIPARLKLAHILLLQGVIESVVSQCDALLRLLTLPRDKTLSSLDDLADLFRDIGVRLHENSKQNEAVLALTIAQRLSSHANSTPECNEDVGINDHPTISLAMIVKNEADCLQRCLESVRPLVDEMVIIDTGSTDDTPAIARRCGAKVYSFPWNDDFSAARNFALSKVKGEWTLVMDADEVIAIRDLDKIKDLVSSGRAEAYRLLLRNYVADANYANAQPNPNDYQEGDGYPGFIPASLIRLFKTSPEVRFLGCVHETMDASFADAGKMVAASGIPIHHYGKVMTARVLKKQGLYKNLGISKLLGNSDNPVAYKTLADQFLEMDLFDQAMEIAENGLHLFPDYAELHFDKGLALEKSGRLTDAEKAYQETIKRDINHVGAYNNLAGILIRHGKHDEALKILQGASARCMYHPVFCYTFGLIHSALDNHAEALKHFDHALELAPGFKKVNLQKAIVYLRRNQFDQAIECLKREIENKGDIIPALITLGEIKFKQNDFSKAIHYFQEVIITDPGNTTAGTYLKSITAVTNSL